MPDAEPELTRGQLAGLLETAQTQPGNTMTLERKHGAAKAGQAQNAGTSQAVPLKAGDNLFDGPFRISPVHGSYALWVGDKFKLYRSLDDLMTFLADQAIEKMGRVEQ